MTSEKKIKTALDELRMLMMGAQILLGFQFQAPFQVGFAHLPAALQSLGIAAIVLMIVIVGLLIMPNAYHRIAENGEATLSLQRVIRSVAGITMLPLAAVVAIDMLLALQQSLTPTVAMVVAGTIFSCTCCLWYAVGFGRETDALKGRVMPENSKSGTSLSAKIEYVLTEARVVLPGAQALLGFQLVIVLTEAFERLPKESKFVHVLALSLVAIATFLLIAPAAHHRIVFGGEDTPLFHRRASWMLLLSTVALALGIAADAYVVTAKIAASRMIGVGAASASAFFLIGLWHVWPALQRARRRTLHPLKEAPAASPD